MLLPWGWFGRGPGDQLMPGWICDTDSHIGWTFGRYGRLGYESYQCHPFTLGIADAINDTTHYMYVPGSSTINGRWNPEEATLRHIERVLLRWDGLAQWAYHAAAWQLERLRCDVHAAPSCINLAAAPIAAAPRNWQAPPTKAYPGTAPPTTAAAADTAAAAEQSRQEALRLEEAAGRVRAARGQTLERATGEHLKAAHQVRHLQQVQDEQAAVHRRAQQAAAAALSQARAALQQTEATVSAEEHGHQQATQLEAAATKARLRTEAYLEYQQQEEARMRRGKQEEDYRVAALAAEECRRLQQLQQIAEEKAARKREAEDLRLQKVAADEQAANLAAEAHRLACAKATADREAFDKESARLKAEIIETQRLEWANLKRAQDEMLARAKSDAEAQARLQPQAPSGLPPRPAGSSNDPPPQAPLRPQIDQLQRQQQHQQQQLHPHCMVAALGFPFVNPPITLHADAQVPFPGYDPLTGWRPAVHHGWWTSDDHTWSHQRASEKHQRSACGPDSATGFCPVYRQIGALGSDRKGAALVTARCSMANCGVPLCGRHLLPNDRGSTDRRHKYCPSCITRTPRCSSCGTHGVDSWHNTHKELGCGTNRHHKPRNPTLWPCGQGCHHLLCVKCGTSRDGCALHQRKEPCSRWFGHWGIRRFPGPVGYQGASGEDGCLTDAQAAQLAAAIDAAYNGAQPPPLALTAPPQEAAPPAALAYHPQMLPAPQLQADGTTVYAGETTAIPQEPLIDLQSCGPLLPPQTTTVSATLSAFRDPETGDRLEEYIDTDSGDTWLCHQGQDDFVCWVKEYQEYCHPQVGVSQATANALAAGEVAYRAAADAAHYAEKAPNAEMTATAYALKAAEADHQDKV